jgi:dienelactone hydrolase
MASSLRRRNWFLASVIFSVVGTVLTVVLLWSASRGRQVSAAVTEHESREVAVVFPAGESSLAGLLLLPAAPAPHPAVVFVNDAGAADRNGAGTVASLARHLLQHGIASLVWDRPGVGASTGDFATQSIPDRADEALAAVRFLRSRSDIQRRRVGVVGFGQGGVVAPLAAALSSDVACVVTLAASQLPAHEQEMFLVEDALRADGFSDKAIAEALELTKLRLELVRGGGMYQELDETQKVFIGRPWFEYVRYRDRKHFASSRLTIEYDPAPSWAKVHSPVLALFADKDPSCRIEPSVTVIRQGLEKAGNTDLTIKAIPKADHGFAVSETGGRKEARQRAKQRSAADGVELAPGYLDTVGSWLLTRLGPPPR